MLHYRILLVLFCLLMFFFFLCVIGITVSYSSFSFYFAFLGGGTLAALSYNKECVLHLHMCEFTYKREFCSQTATLSLST